MKTIFLKCVLFSVASILFVEKSIAAGSGEVDPEAGIDEVLRYPLAANEIAGLKPFLSTKFFSASELRSTNSQSSLIGDVGIQFGSTHYLYFRGQRVNRDQAGSIDKFRFSYRWNLHDQTALLLKATNIDQGSGITRTDLSINVHQGIPTTSVKSSVGLGYKDAEGVFTQVEARYSVAKNLKSIPLRLSTTIKWRQRERAANDVVGGMGGSIGLRYRIQPRFSIALNYIMQDDLSTETTSISSSFSRNIGRNAVTFKVGAASDQVAFFRVQSLLNI